jgi:UDP-N-acetylmuramyl pentapeptide synthase
VIELLAGSGQGTAVLVKASRSVGLEHLVARLLGTEHDQGVQG